MQADILHLEQELNIVEYEDKRSDDKSRASLHASFFNLKESSGERHDVQWNKVKEIQEKLGLYNRALFLFSRVQALPNPCMRDLNTLQKWLDRPEGGDLFLQGREADTWSRQNDVLTLSQFHTDRDALTGVMNDMIIPWFYNLCSRWDKRQGRQNEDSNGVWHYQYDRMMVVLNAISTVLSSLLPSTSIFVLYFLRNPIARLAAIMVFTTIFSSTLLLVTKARRIDIFAATTARTRFAAVQAVFVGGSGLDPT
ncbi:MAG: hypothetical protein Q9196_006110 [Gyalolechia fulgens]